MAGDDFDDGLVANLLKQDAKTAAKKYDLLGIEAFNPKSGSRLGAPKPNTNFLKHIIRQTDSHNAALLAKEAAESRARLREMNRGEGSSRKRPSDRRSRSSERRAPRSNHDDSRQTKRRRLDDESDNDERRSTYRYGKEQGQRERRSGRDRHRDTESRRRRRSSDNARDEQSHRDSKRSERRHDEERRAHKRDHKDRPRRSARSRSRDRKRNSYSRSRSRTRSASPRSRIHHKSSRPRLRSLSPRDSTDKRNGSTSGKTDVSREKRSKRASPQPESDSDPLEALVGPLPPAPRSAVRARGRGALKANSMGMDARFSSTYDASADVQLHSDVEDEWGDALETFRDRQAWMSKRANRLRDAGFSDEVVKKWEKGDNLGEEDVVWASKGQDREWDRGKVVDEDGDVNLKADWGRLK